MTNSVSAEGAPMRARLLRLALSTALCTSIAGPALAQVTQAAPPPRYNNVDDLGIDLTTGQPNISFTEGSIGPANGGIAFTRTWTSGAGWTDSWTGGAFSKTVGGVTTWYVEHGPLSETFVQSGSTFTNQQGTGSTLSGAGGGFTYTATDGTVTTYTDYNVDSTGYMLNLSSCSGDQGTCLLPSKIVKPTGLTYTLSWTRVERCPNGTAGLNCGGKTYYRLASISSNAGYQLAFSYSTSTVTGAAPPTGWFIRTSAQYTNTKASCGTSCPSVTYPSSSDYVVVDPAGRQWQFSGNSGNFSKIRKPGSASDDVTIGYDANGHVSSVNITDLGTWGYNISDIGSTRTAIVTDPLGHTKTVVSDMTIGRPSSVTNGEGKKTTYTYWPSGLLKTVVAPDGNYTQYTYDARGNLTENRQVAIAGSGLADVVSTAGYDGTCSSVAKCNSPNWTKDANNNQTDYTYDLTTGNVLTVQAPAPSAGGARPTTTYSYSTVNSAQVLAGTSTCVTGTSCAGTANELKTSIGYNVNSLPATLTRQVGDGSVVATTTLGYDNIGNVTSVDGPLAGTDDTTYYRYNADREVVGVVAPDPDGSGPLVRKAQRNTYNGRGRITLAEIGTVTDASDAAWAAFSPLQQVASTYDDVDRPLSQTASAGGTTYSVTQSSYNHHLLDCTASRLNSAAWGTLPGSACTLQTPGADGPDRVTQYSYDKADRPTKVTSGLGTADASDDVAIAYTNNGQQLSVTDANSNVTAYAYDGLDRLQTTTYPGGGYEQLGYDANGNVLSRRLRDGKSIALGYDALNRRTSLTFNNPVDVTDSNVVYSYDLLNNLTLAQDGNGHKVGHTYDALGRATSETGAWGTLASQYDAADRRTRLTWDDGFFVSYEYDTTDNMTAIRENGGFLLASFGYDNLGRRVSRSLGNGTSTSYGYDGASRLTGLNLNGGSQPNATTFGFNAAGQISSRTASNDAFAWTGASNVDRAYSVNGLNQYTASGSVIPTYDGRGNLTAAGGATYLYNSKNQLSGANGSYIYYDPAGRIDQVTQSGLAWDWDGNALVTERQGGVIVKRYVHGPAADEPIVAYSGAGTGSRNWLDADERGSIVRITDDAGNAVTLNKYDEFGIPATGNAGRFQYTGQIWLSELGFQYSKARMYSPTLGRFMQTDPIGYNDGVNWYNYVGSDPINLKDPLGLIRCPPAGNEAPPDCEVFVPKKQVSGNGGGGYAIPAGAVTRGGVGGGSPGPGGGGGRATVPLPQSLQRNGQKPPSHDEGDPDYNRDLNKCRALADAGNRAAASRCYSSAETRKGLRDGGTPEGQLPPLITWRNAAGVAGGVAVGTILYWVISEGSRILFPPRNLVPVP